VDLDSANAGLITKIIITSLDSKQLQLKRREDEIVLCVCRCGSGC